MSIVLANLAQAICTSDPEMTADERRQFFINWRNMTFSEKLHHLQNELHSIIITLIARRTLNEQKLSKILSLNITLN
jgi:hypothetical protein